MELTDKVGPIVQISASGNHTKPARLVSQMWSDTILPEATIELLENKAPASLDIIIVRVSGLENYHNKRWIKEEFFRLLGASYLAEFKGIWKIQVLFTNPEGGFTINLK